MLLLFFALFLGHSMNNLKDIPFAVGYLVAILISCDFERYPVVKLKTHDRGHAFGNRFGHWNPFRGLLFVSVTC